MLERMFDDPAASVLDLDASFFGWDDGNEWVAPQGPAPAALSDLPASAGLALELEFGLPELGTLSDTALLSTITSWARVAAWAQANGARALAEFGRRRATDPVHAHYAADEIGPALRLATGTAQAQLDRAAALDAHLAPTRALWEQGALDERRVAVIVDGTRHLSAEVAAGVQTRVLPAAPGQTAAQLRAAVRRAVIDADPAGAEDRHRAAHADRGVQLYPEPDGMATLSATMSAPEAVGCFERLTRLARGLGADDPRSMDARRADLLAGLILGRIVPADVAEPSSAAPAAPDVVRPVGPSAPLVHVVIDFDTLRGAAEHAADLAGYGPITADAARAVAADAVWRRIVTDPLTGTVIDVGRTTYRPPTALADLVRARDGTCRFPGCRRSAAGCELDHLVPFPDGPTSAGNLADECSRHHHLKHDTDWHVVALPDGALEWTSPTGATYRTYPRDHRPSGG
jgi:hypothetical protein